MNFQLLNDTICGEPRLIAIVDDTDASLERTTRAVFPAARICMDTANGRNRMIVLLDHATTEVTTIAKSFFMKPDNKMSVQIVAVPHTAALCAEKQPVNETPAKTEEAKAPAAPAEEKVVTETPAVPVPSEEIRKEIVKEPVEAENSVETQSAEDSALQNEESVSPIETGNVAKPTETKAEEVKIPETVQTSAKESALSKKEIATVRTLWGEDAAFEETFQEANKRFHVVCDTMHPEDSKEAFLMLLEKDEEKCGKKTLQLQLKWLDAIGSYCKTKESKGAREAAESLLARCLNSKQLYANGRACLQSVPGMTSAALQQARRKQNAESFAAYFDSLSKEEQSEVTRQIFQTMSFEKVGKK